MVTAFGFAVVTISITRLPILLATLGIACTVAWVAGISMRALGRRLLALEAFMLVLVAFLPFSVPGEPAFRVLGMVASEAGLIRALHILVTASSIVVAVQVLLGSMHAVELGYAFGRLRVPAKLVHLFLFTVRYVDVLQNEYLSLRRAMRARAFAPATNLHTWRSIGWLVGMLLVRSLERGQRVLSAMRCRGFTGEMPQVEHQPWQIADGIFALLAAALFGALLFGEHQPWPIP
jgi:cobalt/nickel transport system permease protein